MGRWGLKARSSSVLADSFIRFKRLIHLPLIMRWEFVCKAESCCPCLLRTWKQTVFSHFQDIESQWVLRWGFYDEEGIWDRCEVGDQNPVVLMCLWDMCLKAAKSETCMLGAGEQILWLRSWREVNKNEASGAWIRVFHWRQWILDQDFNIYLNVGVDFFFV